MTSNPAAALNALRGLALGDAFGETWFFHPTVEMERLLKERVVTDGQWHWTDDTAMALGIYRMLRERGEVVQDELAVRFAKAYRADPLRNYGPSMHGVLKAVLAGENWEDVTTRQFGGQGSWGNGAAMRVAPLGAWFSGDLDKVAEQARLSARVTHAHAEAAAGAVAVAVAAALAVQGVSASKLIGQVAAHTPESEVAARLKMVAAVPFSTPPQQVAAQVGCGIHLSSVDTVPYTIWCAARHLDDLTEALWTTASPGGDIDTTCAIVGGIIGGRTGLDRVPTEWVKACESLPEWVNR